MTGESLSSAFSQVASLVRHDALVPERFRFTSRVSLKKGWVRVKRMKPQPPKCCEKKCIPARTRHLDSCLTQQDNLSPSYPAEMPPHSAHNTFSPWHPSMTKLRVLFVLFACGSAAR